MRSHSWRIGSCGLKTEGSVTEMEFRNNNRSVERKLERVYYKENRTGNILRILTVAMAVILLYGAFSVADGKLRSDYLIDVRGMGTASSVSLENGSEKQYEKMKTLPYLMAIGIKKTVTGGAFGTRWTGNLVYLDHTAYEKLFAPAFTDIHGTYPVKENEIMLPVRALQQMEIEHPQIGMEIDLRLDGKAEEQSFFLVGYYTDYVDSAVNIPEIYVSEAFLESQGIKLFPADKIMAVQTADLDGRTVEGRLYSDLEMEYDAQQVVGENPMVMQSVEGVFGSSVIVAGCGALAILCAFMMIYNVVSILAGKEIRQYGLLKVIGTTNAQLRRIARRQNGKTVLWGLVLGGIIGSAAVKAFLPGVLKRLFLQGLGESDVSGFYPIYLLAAMILAAVSACFAADCGFRKVLKWNELRALKYVGTGEGGKRQERRSGGKLTMRKMAWRNVTRSKKRLAVSLMSLLLGGIAALGAIVITTGSSIENQIREKPDFEAGILAGIFRYPEKVPEEIDDNTPVLSESFLEAVSGLDGIKKETFEATRGSYAVIDFSKDRVLQPRKESLDESETGIRFATLQIVSDEYVVLLEQYVKEQELNLNLTDLREGNGCILFHYHEMSELLNEKMRKAAGNPVHFYSLDAYGKEESQIDRYEKGSLVCDGYLDFTAKYFPKLQTTSMGNGINYFILTQKAFEQLGFSEKTYDVSFDAEETKRVSINQKLAQLVQQENEKSGEMDTFYFSAGYILLQMEKNRIDTANLLLGAFSGVLLVIGVMNYCNTILSGRAVRKREFETLESIGMTRQQYLSMLGFEGLYYWLLTMMGLLTAGSAVLWLLAGAIRRKLLYFSFTYPFAGMAVLTVLMLAVNLGLVWTAGLDLEEYEHKSAPIFRYWIM